jgi:hypothetical protein
MSESCTQSAALPRCQGSCLLLYYLGSPRSHVGSPRRVPSTGTCQGEAFSSRLSFDLGPRSIAIGLLCYMMTRLQTGCQELASATLVYGERLSDERELKTDHCFFFFSFFFARSPP